MESEEKSVRHPDWPDHPDPGKVLATFAYSIDATHLASAYRAQIFWVYTRPKYIFSMIFLWGFMFSMLAMIASANDKIFADWFCWMPPFSTMGVAGGIAGAAAGFAVYLARWALACIGTPKYARRIYRQQKDMQDEMRIILTENGMRTVKKTTDGYAAWENYIAWGQNRRVMRLYRSDALFQFIPASAITPDAQVVFDRKLVALPRR